MPRPSRNLTRTSVYLPADALAAIDELIPQLSPYPAVAAHRLTRSDVIRLAVEDYLRSNR